MGLAPRETKGFTLVEILIVIAIIGVLAAVIIPRMGGFFSQGKKAAFEGEKKTIRAAVDAYFANPAVEREDLGREGPGIYPTYSGNTGPFPDPANPQADTNGSIINMDLLISSDDDYAQGYIKEGYISDYPSSSCQLNGNTEHSGQYCWYVNEDGEVHARYWDADESEWAEMNGYQGGYEAGTGDGNGNGDEGSEEEEGNSPPVAYAGEDVSVNEGSSTELDGTESTDPDEDTLDYSWVIITDPTGEASLTDSDTATPVFSAPSVDSDTDVTIELTVDDGHGHTDTDTVAITIRAVQTTSWWMVGRYPAKVYKYDSSWEFTQESHNINSQSDSPTGIFQDSNGNWWMVAEGGRGQSAKVYKYDSSWDFTGESHNINSQSNSPTGICQDSNGNWWMVAEGAGPHQDATVYKYDTSWNFTGTSYDINSESDYPAGIFEDSEGNWWMVARGYSNATAYKYNSSWDFIESYDISSQNHYVTGMSQDSHGNWWIVTIGFGPYDATLYKYDSSWNSTGTAYDVSPESNSPTGIFRTGE
ncbi:MAG: PKD domain-containing protein [Chloroflexota bacterium]